MKKTDPLPLWHENSVWHWQYLLTKDLLLVSFFSSERQKLSFGTSPAMRATK